MPIYEYRCTACGHELESLQKFSDAPLSVCPACETPSLTKLVSAAGFHLKGSGWYATDFRNKDSGGKGGKPETKTESANDAKVDSGAASTAAPAASAPACGSGGCASCS
jgi:putative FmdB family regulatory protein